MNAPWCQLALAVRDRLIELRAAELQLARHPSAEASAHAIAARDACRAALLAVRERAEAALLQIDNPNAEA